MDNYKITKLNGGRRESFNSIRESLENSKNGNERFLFVSPHDDDAILGGGLTMQLALKEGIEVYLLIVTDGSMGYCSEEEKNTITDIRHKETYACYEALGIPRENIIWLGYPDCRINLYRGRREASQNDPAIFEGFTGMQNSFTAALREIAPSRCFVPTIADLHPDHRFVYEEFMISIFHSTGTIWPELGKPMNDVPDVYEMGVYCDFPKPPTIQVAAAEEQLNGKINAINKFESQTQIASLIDIVRENGSFEYFSEIGFNLYSPAKYRKLFE
ncbi:MAG: PIG-L deacetylase family protein [Sedimentisphaeraceae bacterium JB056]